MADASPQHAALELALRHHRAGRLAEAEAIYRQILAEDPDHVDARHRLALIAQHVGRHADAITLLRRAAALDPRHAEVHAALGASLAITGDMPAAADALERAIQLNPDLTDVRQNLARVHFQLGLAVEQSGRREQAAEHYRRATEVQPTFAEAHFNLGACLSAGGDGDEVFAHVAEAARLRPDLVVVHEKLLHLQHYTTDIDPARSFERHRDWAKRFAEPRVPLTPPHANVRDPDRRLRVGYVSPDFRRHSVTYFLEPLLAAHEKSQVEIVCYADEIKRDATTKRLRTYADGWRTITGRSHEEVTRLVRADAIDILVDLVGHVAHNRLPVFAAGAAPVQVSYLGYPDTTGLTTVHYRLTDALADPPGEGDAFYAEQLVRLPDCAWCYRPDEASPPCGRDETSTGGGVTFGCFNVATKINAPLIATWAAILRATPGSRMIIKDGQGTPSPAHPRLRREFARHGIGPERLELLSFVPDVAAHLALYRRVDVALDTFPYNGTTTTCEAMWMGVPVVTRAGRHHISRVGASLLNATGLPDLVSTSAEDYIAIVTKIAGDAGRRAQLRRDLREQMRRSPLMDAPRFARNVEQAYRDMWTRWCYARG